MPASSVALNVDQGCGFSMLVTVTPQGSTTPLNLTGATAEMQIRARPSITAPVLVDISTTSNAMGSLTLGGSAGTISVVLTAAATALLPTTGTSSFDIALTFPGQQPFRALKGTIACDAGVTFPNNLLGPQ